MDRTQRVSSTEIRQAMQEQEVFGNHRELGLDADGWMVCSATVDLDGTTYRVEFTVLPDWSDWSLTNFRAV